MTIIPLRNYVLFEQITSDTTAGGLHLPESAQIQKGSKVISVGQDVKGIKKGDIIIFNSKELANVKMDDGSKSSLFLVPDTDIIAIKKGDN